MLIPRPGGWMRASRVGAVTPGDLGQWEASDWFDPETWAMIQWFQLTPEQREQSVMVARAMARATGTNPLAH